MKAVACLIALALVFGGCSKPKRIVVGSKNFTEQVLLGEIVARHIEGKLRVAVERRLNFDGTMLAHEALVAGQIDVYPEYSGTAFSEILRLPYESDPAVVFARVQREYGNLGLEWMPPLGFDNSFAMVIRAADAKANRIETIGQAVQFPPRWRLGVGFEFMQRPDGYAALMKAYNLPQSATANIMDRGLPYRALVEKKVDMVAGYATDGILATPDVVQLRDDLQAFPPYSAALVARQAALAQFPGLREALSGLSGKFSEQTMRKLNYEVDVRHRPVPEVAKSFLHEAGLE
ncbi:MAG: glycine betaine ABC transporter substrate-binding protein [Bryobacteraceae bacterium]